MARVRFLPPLLWCLLMCSSTLAAESGDSSDTTKNKVSVTKATVNALPTVNQKSEFYYQPLSQSQGQQSHYLPIQYYQKPAAVQQPAAMYVIAQPQASPYVSQSPLYSSATQQLLNYFNSNPQAKLQLLQGYQTGQHSFVVPSYGSSVAATQPTAQYQVFPVASPYSQFGGGHSLAQLGLGGLGGLGGYAGLGNINASPIQLQQLSSPVQYSSLSALTQAALAQPQFHQAYSSNPSYSTLASSGFPQSYPSQLHTNTMAAYASAAQQQYQQQYQQQAPAGVGDDKTTPVASGSNFTPISVYKHHWKTQAQA